MTNIDELARSLVEIGIEKEARLFKLRENERF